MSLLVLKLGAKIRLLFYTAKFILGRHGLGNHFSARWGNILTYVALLWAKKV